MSTRKRRPFIPVKPGVIALLLDCELPAEVEIDAFRELAEKLGFAAGWEAAFGVPFPQNKEGWFHLLGAGAIPPELFVDGKIRPRDVLAFIEGKRAGGGGPAGMASEPAPAGAPLDDLVTLSQAAALVNRSKRTLERWKDALPAPDVPGGNGVADRWYWRSLRPVLATKSGMLLPERFPGSRII